MKKLTNKEKEIMDLYWTHGPMFVKELLEYYDEPRPHFNTLSTMVRILEKEGYLDHKQFHQELLQRLLPLSRFLVCQGGKDFRRRIKRTHRPNRKQP